VSTTVSAAPSAESTATPRRESLVLPILFLLFLFALPLRGLLLNQGPPMEEGFMLVFPERVLHGDLPNRDFLHLYGPGSLWAIAAAFWVFGTSLLTERLFALAQEIALVLGVLFLVRPWGRLAATLCAAITLLLIVPPLGLTAIAWVGALALGVWALVAGLAAWDAEPRRAARLAVVSGLLAGGALLFRPDLVLAVSASLLAIGWRLPPAQRRRLAVGLAAGLAPYLVHVLTAGLGNVVQGMLLDPLLHLRAGRSLPIPPSPSQLQGYLQQAESTEPPWPLPALALPLQLFTWFVAFLAAVAFLLGATIRAVRRRGSALDRRLLVLALFGAGIAPQALQRADSAHLGWVSCVLLAFVPLAAAAALGRSDARTTAIAAAAALVAIAVVIPHWTVRGYGEMVADTFGLHRSGFAVHHDGRTFSTGRADVATDLEPVLQEAYRRTEPGDRVFVGPLDLRKTAYVDSYVYFLLPELEPATYYIEMDPGIADAPGSGMAEDLASADVAILSPRWDDWDEPNESGQLGSDETATVLEEQFCPVLGEGTLYVLYERCR
jgi:hypothetical protein